MPTMYSGRNGLAIGVPVVVPPGAPLGFGPVGPNVPTPPEPVPEDPEP